MGITPDRTLPQEKRPTLRTVALMVRAGVRMKRGAEEWAKSKKIQERLLGSLESMRRKKLLEGGPKVEKTRKERDGGRDRVSSRR
jgi:hypothetical protein